MCVRNAAEQCIGASAPRSHPANYGRLAGGSANSRNWRQVQPQLAMQIGVGVIALLGAQTLA